MSILHTPIANEMPHIIFRNGKREYFDTDAQAYQAWLSMPGTAIRNHGDTRPVYGWECNV